MVDNLAKSGKIQKISITIAVRMVVSKQAEQLNLGSAVFEAVSSVHKGNQGVL